MPPRISTGAARPQVASRRLAQKGGRGSWRFGCAHAVLARQPHGRHDQRQPASTPGIMPAANSAGTEAPGTSTRVDDEGDRRRDQDVGGRGRADHAGRERPAGSRRAPSPRSSRRPPRRRWPGPSPRCRPGTSPPAIATSGSMPGPRPTHGDREVDQPLRHARAVEDRAHQHEHRQRQQRVLGDAGVEVLRHGQQAEPLRVRRWPARWRRRRPAPAPTPIGTPSSISAMKTTKSSVPIIGPAPAADEQAAAPRARDGQRQHRQPDRVPPLRHADARRGLARSGFVPRRCAR